MHWKRIDFFTGRVGALVGGVGPPPLEELAQLRPNFRNNGREVGLWGCPVGKVVIRQPEGRSSSSTQDGREKRGYRWRWNWGYLYRKDEPIGGDAKWEQSSVHS